MATMPVAAGDARHMVVEMADEFRAVVGGRDGPGGRIVRAGVVTVMTTWGPNEGEGDAESVAIKELRFGVGQGGALVSSSWDGEHSHSKEATSSGV